MVRDPTEMISYLDEQRELALTGIRDRVAAVDGCSDLDDRTLMLLSELSGLADSYRLYRDLKSRLEEGMSVEQAYTGLMTARLSNAGEFTDAYLQNLGEEAWFAGLGLRRRFAESN